MTGRPVVLSWSSGKDSTLTLYRLQQGGQYTVKRLVTTVNVALQRVTMHGLPLTLLEAQAAALGLPLEVITTPENPDMDEYRKLMLHHYDQLRQERIDTVAFGDIFLADLRKYREEMLTAAGLQGVFPLWQTDSRQLMREFIGLGFKAIVIGVSRQALPASFCGRPYDLAFLADLPDHVDPAGENGEFHTFCYDGPLFEEAIRFTKGKTILKTYPSPTGQEEDYGFWFCDLQPA